MSSASISPAIISDAGSTTDAALAFLRDLAAKRFWGNVTVKFQSGSVIHLTKEESIPADKLLRPNTRSNHEPRKS